MLTRIKNYFKEINRIRRLMKEQSVSDDLLYGVVLWINGNPVLDGMNAFLTKSDALLNISKREEIVPSGIKIQYTIIRIEKAIQR